jgi:Leucine-rich repeat (LRR) protein
LPSTINRLKKLELLDISNNSIGDIRFISFMPELRILNLSGNKCLSTLPPELATCENLHDLVFDIECISNPTRDVLATGVQNILKFLSTGELTAASDYASEDKMIMQSKVTSSRIMSDTINTTKKFMDKEKFIMTQEDNYLENELHKEQQKKKEEMLKSLLEQQKQAESVVNKMQTARDRERKKLIDNIVECKFNEF